MIRPYEARDQTAVLAINEANVPAVGRIDLAQLDQLVEEAQATLVVEVDQVVVGFMILLGPNATYASPNYAWFSASYESFTYVDRVALAESALGQGWGPALYRQFQQHAEARDSPVMCAEVNTVPPNPRSLRFHELFGFVEVERRKPYGPEEEVAMLVKRLD